MANIFAQTEADQLPSYLQPQTYAPKPSAGLAAGVSSPAPKPNVFQEIEEGPANNYGAVGSAAAGALGGLPIVGPEVEDKANWLGDAITAWLTGQPMEKVQGLDKILSENTKMAHPVARKIGEVGGGALGYAALGAAAPAIVGGGSLPLAARAAIAAGSNAAIGAGDEASREYADIQAARRSSPADPYVVTSGKLDPDKITNAGKIGGMFGAAAPVGGAIAGAIARPAIRAFSNWAAPAVPGMRRSAANALSKALMADNPAGSGVVNRLQNLGPDASLADVGPATFAKAQKAIAPGATPNDEGRSIMFQKFEGRAAGSPARIKTDLAATVGPDIAPASIDQGLKDLKRIEGSVLPSVYAKAPPVDITGVLSSIGQRLNKLPPNGIQATALRKIRDLLMMKGTGGLPRALSGAEQLDSAKGDIDTFIDHGDPTLGVTPGSISKTQGAVADIRKQLNQALRDQVPGYGDTMDKLASLNRQIEQLQKGAEGIGDVHPSDLSSEFQGMSPGERAARQAGVASDIYKKLGKSTIADRAALKGAVGAEDDKWARQNLQTLYGQTKADLLSNALDREKTMADSENVLLRGSKTAQTLQSSAEENAAPLDALKHGAAGALAITHPAAALGVLGAKAWDKVANAFRSQKNLDMAKAFVSGDPVGLAQALIDRGAYRSMAGKAGSKAVSDLTKALIGYEGSMDQGKHGIPALKSVGRAALPIGAWLLEHRPF